MTERYAFHAIAPAAKPRMTQRDKWAQRPAVLRYRDYCDELRAAMPAYELPTELRLRFYIAMPRSWSKKDRAEKDGKPHDQKPDIDNLAKAFMDAFKSDDSHVAKLYVEKYWAEAGGIQVGLGSPS